MGLATHRPVFVFGLPRSGTTLIEQVLASHSQVHGAGELRFVQETWNSIPIVLAGPMPSGLCCRPRSNRDPAFGSAARKPVDGLDRRRGPADCEQDAHNYLHSVSWRSSFPAPRSSTAGGMSTSPFLLDDPFPQYPWANDMGHVATRFRQYRRVMEQHGTRRRRRMLEVDYEETVADLERVAAATCRLVRSPLGTRFLRFHETQRPIRTASVTQVRQPIYGTSVAPGGTTKPPWPMCLRGPAALTTA